MTLRMSHVKCHTCHMPLTSSPSLTPPRDQLTLKPEYELQDKTFTSLTDLVKYYQKNGVNPKDWHTNQLLSDTLPKESHINKELGLGEVGWGRVGWGKEW